MKSNIPEFYRGRSILVTGFTSFIGKVLVEKLLRSVPGLKSIYLIIRPMHGANARQRLEKILKSDLFDLIRKSYENDKGEIFSKLIPIDGDLMEPGLGLSTLDALSICENVSVVFHCAATVKFDEHMRQAFKMNVCGTRSLLDLCRKMRHLDAFVHTSTAYCNCDHTNIVERVYPSAVPWRKLVDAMDWLDDATLDRLAPFLIGSRPNSYTFTKAVAESMLIDDRQNNRLPIVIVRPSIVTAAWKEPIPGWVDNLNGATGLIAMGAKGLIKTLYGRLSEVRADLIPVDIVVNTLIVAAWRRAVSADKSVPVIHCTSGRLNPVNWGQIINRVIHNFTYKMPLANLYRFPGGKMTIWRFEYKARLFLQHIVPAYLLDLACALLGRRRHMVRLYEKILKALDTLEYFYTNQWDFQSKAILSLYKDLSGSDKNQFYIDVTQIDWTRYMEDYHWGIRKYIFKEDPSNLAKAKKIHLHRRLLVSAMDISLITFLIMLVTKYNSIRNIVKRYINYITRSIIR